MLFGLPVTTIGLLALLAILLIREALDVRSALDSSRMAVFIHYKGGQVRKYQVKIETTENGESFSLGDQKGFYRVTPEGTYHTRIWRVPTSYYEYGKQDPIIFETATAASGSAIDYQVVAQNTVMRQAFNAFKKQLISQDMALVIIVGAVVVVGGYTWYTLNQQIDLLQSMLLEFARDGSITAPPEGRGVIPGF